MISGEANGGGSRPVYPSSRGQRNNGNHWSSSYPAPCTFGRQLDQNGYCYRTLYPGQQSSCISGFYCNIDYPRQPGVCCLGRHKDFWQNWYVNNILGLKNIKIDKWICKSLQSKHTSFLMTKWQFKINNFDYERVAKSGYP